MMLPVKHETIHAYRPASLKGLPAILRIQQENYLVPMQESEATIRSRLNAAAGTDRCRQAAWQR